MTNPYTTPTTPPPHDTPPTLSSEEKNMAMFAHLSSLLGFIIPLANIIAPLLFWQLKKDTMPYAAGHAKEALNFQISLTIYAVISFILTLVFIGILGFGIITLLYIICTILAAVKANNGEHYRYPFTIRLVK